MKETVMWKIAGDRDNDLADRDSDLEDRDSDLEDSW